MQDPFIIAALFFRGIALILVIALTVGLIACAVDRYSDKLGAAAFAVISFLALCVFVVDEWINAPKGDDVEGEL